MPTEKDRFKIVKKYATHFAATAALLTGCTIGPNWLMHSWKNHA